MFKFGEEPDGEQYNLVITTDGNGSVNLFPAGGIYYEGTTVTLTPVANSGYAFDSWTGTDAGNLVDNGNGTWSITMNTNKEVMANFVETDEATVTFQEGENGYSGTVDTHIMEDEPDTTHGGLESVEWDADDPYNTNQYKYALIRFDAIFGSGSGQIPVGASIQSATLSYVVCNTDTCTGDSADVNEISVDWTEDETWDGFGGDIGVQTDEYGTSLGSADGGSTGLQTIDVTASLASWSSDPSLNKGWIFRPTGTDGVDIRSSEYATLADRPLLTVTYSTGPVNHAPDQPVLVQPLDGATTDVSISPTLEVTVTDPDEDTMDVTFYGRELGTTSPGEDFTIIALPDTQNEAEYFPAVFTSQTQWIADNKTLENIVFVTHLGDIVNTADRHDPVG